MFEIPAAILTILIILGILIAIPGIILLLIKLGVIVDKASKPPHIDHGNYRLEQGQEVKDDSEERY